MAGYSGTSLAQKLGLKAGSTVVALNEPPNYRALLGKQARRVNFSKRIANGCEFVHLFVAQRSELEKKLKRLRATLSDTGMIWASWPKKSPRIASDVSEDVIREVALPLGFVDVKVCAVDETWSGLKLLIRRENRRCQK